MGQKKRDRTAEWHKEQADKIAKEAIAALTKFNKWKKQAHSDALGSTVIYGNKVDELKKAGLGYVDLNSREPIVSHYFDHVWPKESIYA